MSAKHIERADEELLADFLSGNERSFQALMQRHREPILSFAYRFIGDYDDAVDIAQETFIRLYRYAHTFHGEVKFTTWLYTIAANLARTELKRYRRRNGSLLSTVFSNGSDAETWDIPDEQYRPDERVDSSHIAQAVQTALMKVSASYREMVVMRDIQQLTYEEIAQITGTEMGTVKSRINRGRLQLQEQLRDLYHEVFGNEQELS